MSGPERGEDRALSRRILPFFEKFMPSSCQQPAVRDGCHRSASAILKDHIATVGALTSRLVPFSSGDGWSIVQEIGGSHHSQSHCGLIAKYGINIMG